MARRAAGTRQTNAASGAGRAPGQSAAREPSRPDRRQRLDRMGAATSEIVREAAALLDEEVAAGIVAARKIQERFQRERRIDPADFQESLQRLQADAHELVNVLNRELTGESSGANAKLVSRLLSNAHDLVDVLVGVVNMSAGLANELAEANLSRGRNAQRRATPRA